MLFLVTALTVAGSYRRRLSGVRRKAASMVGERRNITLHEALLSISGAARARNLCVTANR
jgi:hypothetical protein